MRWEEGGAGYRVRAEGGRGGARRQRSGAPTPDPGGCASVCVSVDAHVCVSVRAQRQRVFTCRASTRECVWDSCVHAHTHPRSLRVSHSLSLHSSFCGGHSLWDRAQGSQAHQPLPGPLLPDHAARDLAAAGRSPHQAQGPSATTGCSGLAGLCSRPLRMLSSTGLP